MSSSDLEMPESIRTPGRTWTRYPEINELETSEPEVEIEADGALEVFRGEEAMEKLEGNHMELVRKGENRLTALHADNLDSLILVRSLEGGKVEIEYNASKPCSVHLVVQAGRGSELEVTEEFRGDAGKLLTGFAELHVGENATLRYGSLEAADAELAYYRRAARVEDHGRLEFLNGKFAGDTSRTRIETDLQGEGSEVEKLATWYATGEEHLDTSLQVHHEGENTRCSMDSRAVVDDRARSVYEGLQEVGEDAENTSSFQDEEVLTLSQKAEVDASPKLMIENPEVEASHAAGAGDVDGEKLHYLQSRGLDREQAERTVVRGFFEPVLEEIEMPEMKERVRDQVERKLGG